MATTSFGMAIHADVEECDNMLEATCGAGRFNTDDGYLAYMRRKAGKILEEVDANLSKLMSTKPSCWLTHAMHHHAGQYASTACNTWRCIGSVVVYLPSEVKAFARRRWMPPS